MTNSDPTVRKQADFLLRVVAPDNMPDDVLLVKLRNLLRMSGMPVYLSRVYVGTDRTDEDTLQ